VEEGYIKDERLRVIRQVAGMIPLPSSQRSVRVAVDGVDGAGKTTFATELITALRELGRYVVHVSADGFHQVRAVRYRRGRDSAEGFWLDAYDYGALAENVLSPFGPNGTHRFRPAIHDVKTDEILDLPWQTAPAKAVLVVDGLFLHRDELAPVWDFSVFLDVPFDVTVARMAKRDGGHQDPKHPSVARYVEGQRLYFSVCSPWRRADLVIDNSNFGRPIIISSAEIPNRPR
jgi:uridine kinase